MSNFLADIGIAKAGVRFAFAVLGGIILLSCAILLFRQDMKMVDTTGILSNVTCQHFITTQNQPRYSCTGEITYKIGSETITTNYADSVVTPIATGQEVNIAYNPANPRNPEPAADVSMMIPSIMSCVAIICVVLTWLNFSYVRKNQNLAQLEAL